jgi:hypothetical protein
MSPTAGTRPTRARYKLILGGVLLYLLFLAAQMPAVWLAGRLPADSPVQLRQIEGNLWQGAAGHVVWHASIDSLDLGPLRWTLQPIELFRGGLGIAFELGLAAEPLKGQLSYGGDGIHLRAVQGAIDAPVLGFASRALSLLQPQGKLVLDIAELHLSGNRIHGAAQADWRDARSGLVAAPLGDYRAELRADPDGRRARITVQTQQGAVAISGNGDYHPGKGLSGRLVLLPPQDERRERYTPVLNMLGRPDASGAWVLNLDTR